MKKLFIVLSAVLILTISLAVPVKVVLADLIRKPFTMTMHVDDQEIVEWVEPLTTPGGTTHIRGLTVSVPYTGNEPRLVGTSTMTMYRNIRKDGTAQGRGTWSNPADNVAGGSWAGTFTASVDSEGVMRVRMNGRGYGTLEGLKLSATQIGLTLKGTITELPIYDGP